MDAIKEAMIADDDGRSAAANVPCENCYGRVMPKKLRRYGTTEPPTYVCAVCGPPEPGLAQCLGHAPLKIVNKDLFDLERRLASAEWILTNSGFRRCDNPACNCGSWHQVGGFKLRFDEIKEVVEDAGYSTNGRTLLDAVKHMAKDATGEDP